MERTQFKTFRLTPQAARDYIAVNALEQQRPVRPRRLEMLIGKIETGLFRHADIGVAVLDNRRVLVNGQHTCHSVDHTGTTVDAVLEEYRVQSEEELSLLFRQYDNAISSRVLRDLLRIEAHALNVTELPERIIVLTIGALSLNDTRVMQSTPDQKAELLKLNIDRASHLHQIICGDGRLCDFLARGPVGAAIIRTWEKNRRDSLAFWSSVRDGEDLKRTDPPMLLRDFLMGCTVNRGNGATSKRATSNHEIIARSITAWNAHRRGDKLTSIKYHATKEIPRAL